MLAGSDTSSVSARTVAPVLAASSCAAALGLLGVARAEQHLIAALGQLAGDLAPDAAVGAGHQRDGVALLAHGSLSLVRAPSL